ncbi:MAG: hypothetical protein GTN40_04850 [Candidatus Aenigmarchaeota archaeon]|nr:hypothetical protein [Candidatus Aenigmarchaeota archaeon]
MPKKKTGWVKATEYLFLLGIIIAIVAGLGKSYVVAYTPSIMGLQVLIGFIIGLIGMAGMGSIDKAETDIFLLAVVALLAAGGLGHAFCPQGVCVPFIGGILSDIVSYIGILVMPAAVLIALKAIWEVGSTKF